MNKNEKLEVLAQYLFPQEKDGGCNGLWQDEHLWESSTVEAIGYNHWQGSAVWVSKAWSEKSANV